MKDPSSFTLPSFRGLRTCSEPPLLASCPWAIAAVVACKPIRSVDQFSGTLLWVCTSPSEPGVRRDSFRLQDKSLHNPKRQFIARAENVVNVPLMQAGPTLVSLLQRPPALTDRLRGARTVMNGGP
ncbi:hypothetical protein SKAU_G00027990 [Synaphobranchus kaupii]|uniref:Uncharacterized protein n=1 Tax=Synaphobranchus kaupii TaxID=118154 RepID=A0A9Q1GD31_SYNKA|nr:hypothetical protein SKAU_G00027990 [Synaphobranchus kaupii]